MLLFLGRISNGKVEEHNEPASFHLLDSTITICDQSLYYLVPNHLTSPFILRQIPDTVFLLPSISSIRGQYWICNSSDTSIWYTYCDHMNYPISLNVTPCITMKGSSGHLNIYYIPKTVNTSVSFSFKGIRFAKGQYRCVAEAINGKTEEMLFCLNITALHHPDLN
ncbi:lymphocyte antigen 96 isoform X3 [Choloepus didactylus]|uniref:lymphocyte antigen 96 isoform X3 n=1 Tax=Choloepus didactylus TaxID=27675 RepID=UPI0018A0874A|nr:lymphocyte antigen 96 isoform X3 [Choloepus didactylus]